MESSYLFIGAVLVVIVLLVYAWWKKKQDKQNQPRQSNMPDRKPDKKKTYIMIGIMVVVIMVGFSVYHNVNKDAIEEKVSLSEAIALSQDDIFGSMILNSDQYGYSYLELVIADNVSDLTIKNIDDKEVILNGGDKITVTIGSLSILGLRESGFKLPVDYKQEQYSQPYNWSSLVSLIGTLVLLAGLYFISYGGLSGRQGNLYKKEKSDIRFSDIGGLSEIKESLLEIVGFINNRDAYQAVGARIPKGIILEGASGVGKTMLAKAIANEANVPFYYTSGSEFRTMWVGMAAQRVKALFKKASKTDSVIFIDEFDSVASKRVNAQTEVSYENNSTLNQLLAEMDGFKANTKIMVIEATNRVDALDPAILRAGRFDRKINVPMPNYKDRCEILNIYVRNKRLDQDVNLGSIAKQTAGFSGADIDLLVNEAAMIAGRENGYVLKMEHFTKAIDKVLVGEERKSLHRTDEERKIIAYHEASHGVIANIMPDGEKVERMSILQHTKSGGFTRMSQEVEKTLLSKSQIMRNITILLGGRVGEELVTDNITNGASDDIKRANEFAREMVGHYGMSERFGLRYNLQNSMGLGVISNDTAREIDEDVNEILKNCHDKAKEIITKNKAMVSKVADRLLEVETLDGEELKRLMGAV